MGRTKRPLGALATAGLQSRSVGVPEPALLAALGVLNLGAAFYVRKSAAQGAA
jgi:acyl-[acyl-carrier-protein]-phospholipid O-acyltransferase/long-chain-fatty-acid--[acyl-carrier-protein] ligase